MGDLKIVWALFDSETCTVAKALPECEVYSFGKGSGTEHIHLDLSDFETAKKVLDNYPKPDVIFASPPCESWVKVSVGSIHHFTSRKGFNLFWESKWFPFDFKPKHRQTRLNGMKTASTTAAIIKHYKPAFWAIENGASSLVFDYLEDFSRLKGRRNKCNYYAYGFDVLKPTVIYSNISLFLKNFKPRRLLRAVCDNTTGKLRQLKKQMGLVGFPRNSPLRSLVPIPLYRDIMQKFVKAYCES